MTALRRYNTEEWRGGLLKHSANFVPKRQASTHAFPRKGPRLRLFYLEPSEPQTGTGDKELGISLPPTTH